MPRGLLLCPTASLDVLVYTHSFMLLTPRSWPPAPYSELQVEQQCVLLGTQNPPTCPWSLTGPVAPGIPSLKPAGRYSVSLCHLPLHLCLLVGLPLLTSSPKHLSSSSWTALRGSGMSPSDPASRVLLLTVSSYHCISGAGCGFRNAPAASAFWGGAASLRLHGLGGSGSRA